MAGTVFRSRAKSLVSRLTGAFFKHLQSLWFRPHIVAKHFESLDLALFVGDYEGFQWYAGPNSDSTWYEIDFIKNSMVEWGDTIFECGGHHGVTTVILSRATGPEGKVYAWEAHPRNFKILKTQLALNGASNSVAINAAVGDTPATLKFRRKSNSSVTHLPGSFRVPSIKLDNVAHLKPDFIKIDVEGFEVRVLRGATKILAERPKFSIEIHPHQIEKYGDTVEELLALVELRDYSFWSQKTDDEPPKPCQLSEVPLSTRSHLYGIPNERLRGR